MRLHIAYERNPRLEPLLDGTVQPNGLQLDWDHSEAGAMFLRHLTKNEFDAFEFSISHYIATREHPDPAYAAWTMVPIFLTKPLFMFRHFYVRTESGVASLRDLKGKRLGIPDFSMTGGIWLRIMLRTLYGIKAQDVTWINTRPASLRHDHAMGLDRPTATGVQVLNIDENTTPQQMIEHGELDAAIGAPAVEVKERPGIAHLTEEHWLDVLGEFNQATGVTPVNHGLILQSPLIEQEPELATTLFEAFERAKQEAYKRDVRARAVFRELDMARQARLLGDDPYAFGLQANRRVLELVADQLQMDGLIDKLPAIDLLVAESTRAT